MISWSTRPDAGTEVMISDANSGEIDNAPASRSHRLDRASAAASTAAFADPDFVAGLSVGGAYWDGDDFASGDSLSGHHVQGLLSGAYNFTPVLGMQGDVRLNFESLDDDGETLDITSIDGALHGFYRESERFLLGGLVQLGQDEFSSNYYSAKLNRTAVGAEAQAFFDQLTVYGQLGLQTLGPDYVGALDLDGWFITGEVRYFLTPDFKIEAHAGRSELSYSDVLSLQFETVNAGIGAEYKLADLPLSIFAQYDYTTSSLTLLDASIDSHRVLVGLKFNMGKETLQDRDRNGASLKPLDFGPTNSLFGDYMVP